MMKNRQTIITILSLTFIIFESCKDDKSKFNDIYKTDERIIPQSEYTADNPREWKDIADEHIPQYKISTKKGKAALYVEVKLKKASTEHYIERIGILDEKGKEIISKPFPRIANPKSYTYFYLSKLPKNQNLKIYAKCNLHDRWTTPLVLK